MSLALLILSFLASLLVALGASAWFTRSLETIVDLFDLSTSLLSLLGALGANIPNYAASIVALAQGHLVVGLGIIIGSNIYNIAIILALSTFATSPSRGIVLSAKEAQDVQRVAGYTLAIMFTTLFSVWFLSTSVAQFTLHLPVLASVLLGATNLLALFCFGLLSHHALQREPHVAPRVNNDTSTKDALLADAPFLRGRAIATAILTLLLALGAVVVMVQSAQAIAFVIHLSPLILGLLILAIATSLPNTVVAVILARTGRASACVEEVLSSNSINAALGVALPLLIWHSLITDRFLLLLDTPLMLVLTLLALLLVIRRRIGHIAALLLFCIYAGWVLLHLLP